VEVAGVPRGVPGLEVRVCGGCWGEGEGSWGGDGGPRARAELWGAAFGGAGLGGTGQGCARRPYPAPSAAPPVVVPCSKLPSWARAVTPRIFYITEKAWNYYPYTITGEPRAGRGDGHPGTLPLSGGGRGGLPGEPGRGRFPVSPFPLSPTIPPDDATP